MFYFPLLIAKAYAGLYVLVFSILSLQIPGLGFLLRRCKRPTFLPFRGEKLYFEPSVASSYGLHIINLTHEPESHAFLSLIFDQINQDSFFVNVGANIGIFMLDLSRRSSVHVVGFEPSSGCVKAIEMTMAVNMRDNYSIFNYLIGDTNDEIPFENNSDPQGSSVYTSKTGSSKTQRRLDDINIIREIKSEIPVVLMVDVEGYEPKVLRGAKELIFRVKPLIIFEYNHVSKKYFHIDDLQELLGKEYHLFRLRKDTMLDQNFENAWNCVGIPNNTYFQSILEQSICAA